MATAKKGETDLGRGEDAVAVRAVGPELSDASVRPELMAQIARVTGGQSFRLPVEVVRFAWRDTRRRLGALLPDAQQRLRDDAEAYVTDEGHFILDCALPPSRDLAELARAVKLVPGVVEHGLFIGMAERALLGNADGSVDVLERRS